MTEKVTPTIQLTKTDEKYLYEFTEILATVLDAKELITDPEELYKKSKTELWNILNKKMHFSSTTNNEAMQLIQKSYTTAKEIDHGGRFSEFFSFLDFTDEDKSVFNSELIASSIHLLYLVLNQGYEIINHYRYVPSAINDWFSKNGNKDQTLKWVLAIPNSQSYRQQDWKTQPIDSIDTTKYHYLFNNDEYRQLVQRGVKTQEFYVSLDQTYVIKKVPKMLNMVELLNNFLDNSSNVKTTNETTSKLQLTEADEEYLKDFAKILVKSPELKKLNTLSSDQFSINFDLDEDAVKQAYTKAQEKNNYSGQNKKSYLCFTKNRDHTFIKDSLLLLHLALTQGYDVVKYSQYYTLPFYLPTFYEVNARYLMLPNQGSCAPENWKIQPLDSIDTTKYHYIFNEVERQQLLKYIDKKAFKFYCLSKKVIKTVPKTIDIANLLKNKIQNKASISKDVTPKLQLTVADEKFLYTVAKLLNTPTDANLRNIPADANLRNTPADINSVFTGNWSTLGDLYELTDSFKKYSKNIDSSVIRKINLLYEEILKQSILGLNQKDNIKDNIQRYSQVILELGNNTPYSNSDLITRSLRLLYLAFTEGYSIIEYYVYVPIFNKPEKNFFSLPTMRTQEIEETVESALVLPNDQKHFTQQDWRVFPLESIDTSKYHYLFTMDEYRQLVKQGISALKFCTKEDQPRIIKEVPKVLDLTDLLKS